jgi:hypothetical protein
VRYMAFVKDKINPNKAYVDTTSFTEKWKKKRKKNTQSLVRLVSTSIFIFEKKEVDFRHYLMPIWKQSIKWRS